MLFKKIVVIALTVLAISACDDKKQQQNTQQYQQQNQQQQYQDQQPQQVYVQQPAQQPVIVNNQPSHDSGLATAVAAGAVGYMMGQNSSNSRQYDRRNDDRYYNRSTKNKTVINNYTINQAPKPQNTRTYSTSSTKSFSSSSSKPRSVYSKVFNKKR